MSKKKKTEEPINEIEDKVEEVINKKTSPRTIEELVDFKIETLEDFDIYNRGARSLKRPVKVPDETYHKKVKVKFQRFDQPDNVLKAYVRNKDIEWKGQLKPGRTYDLPIPVIEFLNSLVEPIYKEVKVQDDGETITETRQVGERQRFSCQVMQF